ncbi:MAG TPA: AAA family ATPase [Mycobacterium sp.]|nr:AAA family ATPase [Mycobacterium sp.]
MRLHRLTLTNYRGIGHRDIEFPGHGVVVVAGPNEIGKSSMIEALDLLLEARDRSGRKDVKQVKPTHADVGAEVTAEISTGPYRFVYRKRFHKKPETELTVSAPRREQLTGDEAHERVAAILAETVDAQLWRAQRVLQAGSTDAVDLSGCDALSRALDIAASDSATLTGGEPILIEGIDREYLNYFTPTGRRTGGWAAARDALEKAEHEKACCAAAVAEVDERVSRHAELTGQLAGLDRQRTATDARDVAARSAADRVAALTEELSAANLRATAAAATGAASMAAHTERIRLSDEVSTRAATLTELEAQAAQASEQAAAAAAVSTAADVAATEAAELLAAAQRRTETARSVVDRLSDRAEADRLAVRLDRIDTIERDRARITAELAAITITPVLLQAVEDAAAAAELAEVRLWAISAAVEVTAAADVDLVVGDQRVALVAGASWSTTAPTEINVPGVLTVRVRPGVTTLDAQAEFAAAQVALATALEAAAVADVAAARAVEQHRLELQRSHDQLSATLAGLCDDGEQADELRNRLAQLQVGQSDDTEPAGIDSTAAREELDAAEAARAQADLNGAARRDAATAAAAQLAEKSTRATVLAGNVANQQAELALVADRLAVQRASVADQALAATADAEAHAVQVAELRVAELAAQLAEADPDAVAAELADAATASADLRARRDETERALHEVTVQLSVLGTEGRQSKLDAAEADYEHAAAEHARIGRRARAVQLLRSVMLRHRDDTRLRYVAPFRAEIERLGRPVFGDSFEVEIDSELRICNRTLDGCTVPYESLSGGAKEQLGILARLAGAALVAKEDTVPVLIDDALGFTDPARLASMGAVFDAVGAHGQVIVLTCTPDRYRNVKGAHRIDLSA